MPLNYANWVPNGHLIHEDVQQFFYLLTGGMLDQAVLVRNTVTSDQAFIAPAFRFDSSIGLTRFGSAVVAAVNLTATGALIQRVLDHAPTDLDMVEPADGMTAVSTADDHVYFRSNGSWRTSVGPAGQDGVRGATWWTGSGPPPDPIPGSLPDDLWLDEATGDVYKVVP